MKKWKPGVIVSGLLCFSFLSAAQVSNPAKANYTIVDLSTSQTIDVYYDTVSWRIINKVSMQPVDYYIIRYADSNIRPDTVHGVTGIIVNDLIWKNEEGKWMFYVAKVKWDGNEFKMKDAYGRKVKWEQGSLKVKDWNNKYKNEKDDGAKYKEEWDKIKWKDHETKTEIGTQKTKVKQN